MSPSHEHAAGKRPEHGEHHKKEEPPVIDVSPSRKSSTITFIVITVVLIAVLFALVFLPSYIRKHQIANDKYNNFEFVKREDGFWYTVVNKGSQPYSVPFYFHPRDLEDIVVDATIRERFLRVRDNNGSIFITLDPEAADNKIVIAGVEIARITGGRYGLLNVPTHSAFIKAPKNQTANTETPVVTCSAANNRNLVVWITLSDKNIVTADGYCIIAEAKTYNDTVRVADRMMYQLLGVMG